MRSKEFGKNFVKFYITKAVFCLSQLIYVAEDSKEIKDYIIFLQNSQNTMEKNKHIILRKVKHLHRDMIEEKERKNSSK